MQSLRMLKSDNRSMKAVAASLGLSFNLWAVDVLTRAMAREQKKREKEKINASAAKNGQE